MALFKCWCDRKVEKYLKKKIISILWSYAKSQYCILNNRKKEKKIIEIKENNTIMHNFDKRKPISKKKWLTKNKINRTTYFIVMAGKPMTIFVLSYPLYIYPELRATIKGGSIMSSINVMTNTCIVTSTYIIVLYVKLSFIM